MELVEVYVQGVSRFLTPFKFNLTKGYNVVYGGNETGKTVLAKALVAAFDGPFAASLTNRLQPVLPQEGAPRYGALFEHNGERYRLLRDLAGGVNLAKMNTASQKFEPVARDEQGVLDFLQDSIDFPLEGLYPIFGFVDRNLVPASSGSSPAAASFASSSSYDDQMSYGDEQSGSSNEDMEKELKTLRRELGILGSIDQIESRLEGMQHKRYENETNVNKFREFETKLGDITKRQTEIAPIEALTPEFESRVKNLDKQEEYQRQRLQAMDVEIRQLEKVLDVLEPKRKRKFQTDPFFIAGAVAALLGFVLPFITKFYFLSLIGFAALGWLGYLVVILYSKVQADFEETDKKHRAKCNEEEKLKKDFNTATQVIRDLVKTLKVLDAKDLIGVADEWKQLKEKTAAILQAREELIKQGGDAAKLQHDLQRQDAEIALFEEELRNAGAITRDTNQIQAEIARLESVMARGSSTAAPVAAVASVRAVSAGGTGTNLGQFIEGVARLSRKGIDDVVPQLTEKLNTYIRALTNSKLGPAELTADGELSLVRTEFGNRRVGLSELSDGTRDSVLLALRFGALELILPSRPFPVIFDDPFSLLDDQRQAVAAKALKRLAGFSQVVHFTSQKSFLALADNKVELR